MIGVKRILFAIGAIIALSLFAAACYYPPRNGVVRPLRISCATGSVPGAVSARAWPLGSRLRA